MVYTRYIAHTGIVLREFTESPQSVVEGDDDYLSVGGQCTSVVSISASDIVSFPVDEDKNRKQSLRWWRWRRRRREEERGWRVGTLFGFFYNKNKFWTSLYGGRDRNLCSAIGFIGYFFVFRETIAFWGFESNCIERDISKEVISAIRSWKTWL